MAIQTSRNWSRTMPWRGLEADSHRLFHIVDPGEKAALLWRRVSAARAYQAPAPEPLAFNVSMIGPVLIRYGSPEQQARFLAGTANLDIWWAQGLSEPGAGSDLAALRTSAARDGDDYVVTGHKLWQGMAHRADWMFTLVRSDPAAPKRQMGHPDRDREPAMPALPIAMLPLQWWAQSRLART